MSRLLSVSQRFSEKLSEATFPESQIKRISNKFSLKLAQAPRTTILPKEYYPEFEDDTETSPSSEEFSTIPAPPKPFRETLMSPSMEGESRGMPGEVNVSPVVGDVIATLGPQVVNKFLATKMQSAVGNDGQRYVNLTIDDLPLGQYRVTHIPESLHLPQIHRAPIDIHNVEYSLDELMNWVKKDSPAEWEMANDIMTNPR